VTRAQCAEILMRFVQEFAEPELALAASQQARRGG